MPLLNLLSNLGLFDQLYQITISAQRHTNSRLKSHNSGLTSRGLFITFALLVYIDTLS